MSSDNRHIQMSSARFRRLGVVLFLCGVPALLGAVGCVDSDARAQARDAGPHGHVRPQPGRFDAGMPTDAGPPPPRPSDPGFFGQGPDAPILARLSGSDIGTVERGRGGRSVGFKITLTDGTKGYYKPEQTFSAAHWYGEIAAFHLDRELGLGRTPPVVGRRFEWSRLRRYIAGDARAHEVIVGEDGFVRGCYVWWIPEPHLLPWRSGSGWERWVRMQGWPGSAISPFQRARVYVDQEALRHGTLDGGVATDPLARPPRRGTTPDRPDRAAELSDMVLFDYLTNNIDRWGGGNANVLTRGNPGPIVFLDNAAGFTPHQTRSGIMDARLHVVQRFRRATVDAIRAFDMRHYTQRLASDPLAPVLTDEQLSDLETRRHVLLDHVADMQRRYGDGVFTW